MNSNHFVSVSEISLTEASTQMQLASSLKNITGARGWAPYVIVVTFPDTVLCSLLRPFRQVSVRTFLCMDTSSVLRIHCKLRSESSKRSVMSACGAAWRLLNERSSRVIVFKWLSVRGYPDYFLLFNADAVYC